MTISTSDGVSLVPEGYVANTTLASLPSASGYPVGTKAFATNVGLNGTEMVVSSSGTWIPHNGRALLSRLTLPLIKAPTFTGTTNGAITLGTATVGIYAKCYIYFIANSLVASHSAGWYYVEMSSTTAGVVYNNTYTPAAGTYPTEPTSKTAFAGVVPGGAGSTAEITFFIYTLNANLLGDYGALLNSVYVDANRTAGAKSVNIYLNSTNIVVDGGMTSNDSMFATHVMRCIGTAKQRSPGRIANQATTNPSKLTTENLAVDATVSLTLQTSGAATDWLSLVGLLASIEVA